MQTGPGTKSCGSAGDGSAPRSLSLTVLPEPKKHKQTVAKSKVSKWRAAVLISVNVLMLAHLAQWLWSSWFGSGRTISPVEPSESMYTIELGQINAGFVFFSVALLSTFIFGRFFCGWGCHVVSLQDLCAHWMNKIGVRPKPFRSRLLLLAPTVLALYMFVWPTFKRMALIPLESQIAKWVQQMDPSRTSPWIFYEWLVDLPRQPHPGFNSAFVVKDFWHTFPSEWYIIVPFFFVCGFAAVYFLGSKGFCTYGCPYGGFFAPMDKISVGRIVVNDKCEGCGHCTAVCTSNVKVAQEVRDFGMVVDPGCMKCLDCVSVCPNDALSFSFAKPAVFTSARTEEAKQGKSRKPEFDLTWWQDILLFALVVVFFIGFRQMFNRIPLLMAGGMALVGGFIAWKLCTLITQPNVRLQSLQLKLKGRFKPWGALVLVLGTLYVAWGTWGATIQAIQIRANYYDLKVVIPSEYVFAEGYKPSENDRINAEKTIKLMHLAGPPSQGGIGWAHGPQLNLRLAWHNAVIGNLEEAEKHLRRAIAQGEPTSPQWVFQLARVMQLRGKSPADLRVDLQTIVDEKPYLYPVRLAFAEEFLAANEKDKAVAVAQAVLTDPKQKPWTLKRQPAAEPFLKLQASHILMRAGKMEEGLASLEAVLASADPKPDINTLTAAGDIYLQTNQPQKAEATYARAIAEFPDAAFARFQYARSLAMANKYDQALEQLKAASDLEPGNPEYLDARAQLLNAMGRTDEAMKVMQQAQDAMNRLNAAGVKR